MTMERYRRPEAIRDALRERWPLCAFKVRLVGPAAQSRTRISWTDGPTEDAVRGVAYEHEGRLYVEIDRETTADLPAVAPESPPAGPVAPSALLGSPIPYDEATCGVCGGTLELDAGRPEGEPARHAGTRSVYCPCSRCGRSAAGATEVDGAVLCADCQDPSEPGFLPVAGSEAPG